MSQKKETSIQLSQEDNLQIQDLFSRYRQIAERLHNSADQAQTEAALVEITRLSASVQLALLKMLACENNTDAADVLVAIQRLGTLKEVRKEARRGLIRLEATRTYAQWKPPVIHTSLVQLPQPVVPRFLRGRATETREQGEIQLFLCWEQGYDYHEVCMMTFLLDYWHAGVKEVIFETISKRRLDEFFNTVHLNQPDVTLGDCTLAEGKRLIEEALSVNQSQGTVPHETYRQQLALINKRILQATDLGEDRGRTFITAELEEQEVIVNFLGAWSFGDYGLAYDLLTHESSVRDGLSRDEWMDRHHRWYQEAHPTRMELGFVHEREVTQGGLWLPSSMRLNSSLRKNIEVGWSLELGDTPLSGTLKEMPMGTAVNKETGRHWFWTSYTLVHQDGVWRIQHITDEGMALQGLSIHALQARIKEYQEVAEELTKQQHATSEQATEEVSRRLMQILHFYDALMVQLPLDYQMYEAAYAYSILLSNAERVTVYLGLMVERFQERRGDNLRQLSVTLFELARKYASQDMKNRVEYLLQRAEETVRTSIMLDDNALSHILLSEFLAHKGDNDKAEAELYIAQEMHPGSDEKVSIEAGLGHIALQREQMSEAITHYKRVVESNPQYPGMWFRLGFAHRLLEEYEDAERCYQQAIQIEPRDIRSYSELTAIYMNSGQLAQARVILQQAIHVDPTMASAHALLASVLFELGDLPAAQRELEEAERIDPELELAQKVRQHIRTAKRK